MHIIYFCLLLLYIGEDAKYKRYDEDKNKHKIKKNSDVYISCTKRKHKAFSRTS